MFLAGAAQAPVGRKPAHTLAASENVSGAVFAERFDTRQF